MSEERTFVQSLRSLAPFVAGLVCARCGLIAANYGSYDKTDDGVYTDGTMLAALVVIGGALLVLAITKALLSRKAARRLHVVNIWAQAALICLLFGVEEALPGSDAVKFVLAVAVTVTSSLCIFGWLRHLVGSRDAAAMVFCFSALALSEAILLVFSLLPNLADVPLAAIMAFMQIPLLKAASKCPSPQEIRPPEPVKGAFFPSSSHVLDRGFLICMAVGVGFMSLVIGLLRGYPDGLPIPFTPPTRWAYALLTIGISLALIALSIRAAQIAVTRSVWLIMQALACLALLAYALAPDNLEYGAMFTTTLNAVMVGFTWYSIIAFATQGWRDMLYYSFACWMVWLGFRATARMALLFVSPYVSVLVMHTVMAALLLISAHFIFIQQLSLASTRLLAERALRAQVVEAPGSSSESGQSAQLPQRGTDLLAAQPRAIDRIMGLDTESATEIGLDLRRNAMQEAARQIGAQYLLSDREVEVLTLFAMGHTQKKVAEELFIAQSTVHAHIKKIYAKTGLHSRQEILNYIEAYVS